MTPDGESIDARSARPGESAKMHKARLDRAKNYFLMLARRAEVNPDDAAALSLILTERLAEYWDTALEAAMKAAESLDANVVYPYIDDTIAHQLREHPNIELVADLYNRIPPETVFLKKTAVEVYHQTVSEMEARDRVNVYPAEYSAMLRGYVHRLLHAGQVAEADAVSAKELAFVRERHSHAPQDFHDSLIDSLEVSAYVASACGRNEECVELRTEALRILRTNPGEELRLAQCLTNLAPTQRALGDLAGALSSSGEAVALYRGLVANGGFASETDYSRGLEEWDQDPRPALGGALIGLASHQHEAGQFEESLASAQESVKIFSPLSAEYPDAFRPNYGMALHNLSMARTGCGDLVGGQIEMAAAAAVYQHLAAAQAAYKPAYAQILGALAVALAHIDRMPEAIENAEASAEAYRKLEQGAPGSFLKDIARTLFNLALMYEAVGRSDDAQAITLERAGYIGETNQEGIESMPSTGAASPLEFTL